jgi:hypothetical protein
MALDLEQRLSAAFRRSERPKPVPCACGTIARCPKAPSGKLVVPPMVEVQLWGAVPVMHTREHCRPYAINPEEPHV